MKDWGLSMRMGEGRREMEMEDGGWGMGDGG